MEKVTKSQVRDFVRAKLGSDANWAKHALLKIFEFQTAEEKIVEHTHDHNGVGFTGIDGEILTSFAKQLKTRNFLSPKQMALLYKKMPKYWKQIVSISDEEKLLTLIQK
jgi:hypothetical protein